MGRLLIVLVLLAGCPAYEYEYDSYFARTIAKKEIARLEQERAVPEPGKLVFFDDLAWEPAGCEGDYGPLVLELQPGAYDYWEQTFEIRGCVRVVDP